MLRFDTFPVVNKSFRHTEPGICTNFWQWSLRRILGNQHGPVYIRGAVWRLLERDHRPSSPNHEEKWMARHNAASCYKHKTLMDIQWWSRNSRWTPLQRNMLDCPKGYETWNSSPNPQESPRNSQMQTKNQRGTILAWNVHRCGANGLQL